VLTVNEVRAMRGLGPMEQGPRDQGTEGPSKQDDYKTTT